MNLTSVRSLSLVGLRLEKPNTAYVLVKLLLKGCGIRTRARGSTFPDAAITPLSPDAMTDRTKVFDLPPSGFNRVASGAEDLRLLIEGLESHLPKMNATSAQCAFVLGKCVSHFNSHAGRCMACI
jgi:hypothetical protein